MRLNLLHDIGRKTERSCCIFKRLEGVTSQHVHTKSPNSVADNIVPVIVVPRMVSYEPMFLERRTRGRSGAPRSSNTPLSLASLASCSIFCLSRLSSLRPRR